MDNALSLKKSTFSWENVCYTVPVKGKEKTRQLLDNVSGWIAPGKMTALMGFALFSMFLIASTDLLVLVKQRFLMSLHREKLRVK